MKYPKSAEMKKAYESAGYRERYAMEHGNPTCFMHDKTSLKDIVQYLRDKGIVCPHRSYR